MLQKKLISGKLQTHEYDQTDPKLISLNFMEVFETAWRTQVKSQSKLTFYSALKETFDYEPYLDIKMSGIRKSVTRLRSSAHRLNVEIARYGNRKSLDSTAL